MSEVDLVANKNDVIRRKNVLIVIQQLFIFLALAGYVFLIVITQMQPPTTQPNINIITNQKFADGNDIEVPKVITAGEPYQYRIRGEKFVDNSAEVRQQLICRIDGADSFITTNTFTSSLKKGKFDLVRNATIPVSTRLQASNDCWLQSIATYTFYTKENGNERALPYTTTASSNKFTLVVPPQD